MEENRQRNPRRRLNSLILLVAFTAILLIVSTYAWFSTQKNVTLSGLHGEVNVAEGLQISLDALNWTNSIDLSAGGIEAYFAQTNNGKEEEDPDYRTLEKPYEGRTNLIPAELLPVSTTAGTNEGIGSTDLKMYNGENTEGIKLNNIQQASTVDASGGYYAIDFFLQNASSAEAVTGQIADLLRLEPNSKITLDSSAKNSTGLQNTIRVAFALFDNQGSGGDPVVNNTPSQQQILAATNGQNILDVAIWEPNASGAQVGSAPDITTYAAHVDYIVQNNNKVTFAAGDNVTGNKFTAAQAIPTYALTTASKKATSLANIYDWATPAAGLVKQKTLQTANTGVGGDPVQLKSVLDEAAGVTNPTGDSFAIEPGEYHKIRMYVWLEGQDVDCINYASLGGGLTIEVGLSKPGSEDAEP